MEWWKKIVRVLQFNIEDPYGIELNKIKPEDIIDLAMKINANVIVVFARDPWGRAFYTTDIALPHSKAKDFIEKLAILAKKENLKIIAMVSHTANKYLAKKFSDWLQVNVWGEPIVLEHIPLEQRVSLDSIEWPLLCLNSPFGEKVVEEVIDVVEKHRVDGVLLDSFRYQPDYPKACYCKWCRARFRNEYGFDMIEKEDWSDSRWRTLWLWRYRVVVDKIREIYEKLKNVDRDTILMYNNHPAGWSGRANKVIELARNSIDVVFAECSETDHQPPGFITEMAKLTKSLSGDKPVWISRNAFHMYRPPQTTSPLAIRQGLREALLGSASPWILVFSSTYAQDKRFIDAVAQVFKEVEKVEPYLSNAELYSSIGIVFSTTTNDFYGRNSIHRYVDEVRGFYYLYNHSHIPVTYVSELDLVYEKLRKFKAVVLANTVCLSDKAIEEIEKYVSSGGRVIATYLTSYMDEEGIERQDIRLSRVLGIEFIEILRNDWSYVYLSRELSKLVGTETIVIGDMSYSFTNSRVSEELGWHTLIDVVSGEVYGWIGLASRHGYEYTLGRSAPPAIARIDRPAIVLHKHREGASAYLTFQLGRMYWRTGLEDYRVLGLWILEKLGIESEISIDAPETVEISIMVQKPSRYIIQLLNHSHNQRILARGLGRSKQSTPGFGSDEAVHPMRSVVPVTDISVSIDVEKLRLSIDKLVAYSPLTNQKFDIEYRNGKAVIKIPKLVEYDMIVIEEK